MSQVKLVFDIPTSAFMSFVVSDYCVALPMTPHACMAQLMPTQARDLEAATLTVNRNVRWLVSNKK